MYKIFNQSKFLNKRKELRKNLTEPERRLWYYLKGKRYSAKFRRQHGIGPYIVDFYCKEKNLVIELGGAHHLENADYDKERDEYLASLGLTTVRFWNSEVMKDIEKVLREIETFL